MNADKNFPSLAIIVLNYLNYEDTIECVNSILSYTYPIKGIVIIDNNSTNNSVRKLRSCYKNNHNVKILKAGKNYGYAKGNNIGITYAREHWGVEYVLCVNNDTVFVQEEFFSELLNAYEPGIGVIGPQIRLANHRWQPLLKAFADWKCIFIRYAANLCEYYGANVLANILQGYLSTAKHSIIPIHGSAILFTPDFFKCYEGFFDKTFLYEEETILYFMCKAADFRQKVATGAIIIHKEDQSSLKSFKNDGRVKLKYSLQSQKWVWYAKLRMSCRLNKIFNDGKVT